MSHWFADDFRKVHVLYVSPDWATNRHQSFDPETFIEKLKQANCRVVEFYIKDHHGIAYYPTKIGHFGGRDLLGPLVQASHKAGMKFVAYYSVNWDKWARETHVDWADNSRTPENVVQPIRVDSDYRKYAVTQLGEIARHAPIDGIFLDIFGGSEDFLLELIAEVRRYRPEALFTFNGAFGQREELNRHIDWGSIEGHAPNYRTQDVLGRYMCRHGKPYEITTPGGVLGWAHWSPKPASVLLTEGAIAASVGASITVGMNPRPDGFVPGGEFTILEQLWSSLAAVEPYLARSLPVADVGVLVPGYREREILAALVAHHIQVIATNADGDLNGFPTLIVPDYDIENWGDELIEKIRRYITQGGRVLAMHRGGQPFADLLGVEFVGRFPYTAVYGEGFVGDLKDGLPDSPVLIRQRASQVVTTTGRALAGLTLPECEYDKNTFFFGWSSWNPPHRSSGHPLVVEQRTDDRRTLYIATPLGGETTQTHTIYDPYQERLLANLMRRLAGDCLTLKTDLPSGVHVSLREKDSHLMLSLVNTYPAMQAHYSLELGEATELRGGTVWLNRQRLGRLVSASIVPEGREVCLIEEGAWYRLETGSLPIHKLFVISRA
jgi:hypothetical protein